MLKIKKYIVLLMMLLNHIILTAQSSNYINFSITNKYIYLQKLEHLEIEDIQLNQIYEHKIPNLKSYTVTTKDEIYLIDSIGSIFKIIGKEKQLITNSFPKVEKLVFANALYGISHKYIYDFERKKIYGLPTPKNPYLKTLFEKEKLFDCSHKIKTDKKGNIWILINYGEFGSAWYIFDTQNAYFLNPYTLLSSTKFEIPDSTFQKGMMNIHPVDICFSYEDAYIFSALSHMGTYQSTIFKYNYESNELDILFFSSNGYIPNLQKVDTIRVDNHKSILKLNPNGEVKEFISCDFHNDNLYFLSNIGIYKGNINHNLASIKNWKKMETQKMKFQ